MHLLQSQSQQETCISLLYDSGNWNPLLILNCPQPDWFPIEASLFPKLPRPNDGLVSVSGVESQSYFHSLGHSSDCHSNLLSDKEYEMAKPILSRG